MSGDTLIHEVESKIGYVFKDKQYLRQAFTHRSYTNEQVIGRKDSYERLEFLGDAVLDLLVSEFLMDTYPEMEEGDLTKTRSQLVCEPALAHCARQLELETYILLGKGETRSGGASRTSILADIVEAVIGAIYIDGGIDAAKDFVYKFTLIDTPTKKKFLDSKSMVQEYVMKNNLGQLEYNLAKVTGPEHDKTFHVNLYMDGELIGKGTGRNKKLAEQQAAYEALVKIYPQYKNYFS